MSGEMEKLDARLEIRCTAKDKDDWQKASEIEERKLADWLRLVLRRESKKVLRRKRR